MTDTHAPEPGWYDDPELALRLRWWDGTRWSQHTRSKAVVEHPSEQALTGLIASVTTTGSTVIAAPVTVAPYAYSAPYSWSPASVVTASAAAVTPASVDWPASAATTTWREDDPWTGTTRTTIEYAPERTATPAAWALAATPIVTVLAQSAAIVLSGFESTPAIWIIGATIIPVLWIIMWVRRDRITLHEWGHLRRAHWAWAFLGALGYLTARTIVVRRQATGRGWGPLLTNLVITAVLVNVGLFTPVYDFVRDAIV